MANIKTSASRLAQFKNEWEDLLCEHIMAGRYKTGDFVDISTESRDIMGHGRWNDVCLLLPDFINTYIGKNWILCSDDISEYTHRFFMRNCNRIFPDTQKLQYWRSYPELYRFVSHALTVYGQVLQQPTRLVPFHERARWNTSCRRDRRVIRYKTAQLLWAIRDGAIRYGEPVKGHFSLANPDTFAALVAADGTLAVQSLDSPACIQAFFGSFDFVCADNRRIFIEKLQTILFL